MRPAYLIGGLIGSIVIGVTFWLAFYGAVQLSRPVPIVSGPGVAVAPAPVVVLPARPSSAAAPAPAVNGPRAVRIVATDLKFDPKEIKVPVGQPVEVTLDNKGVLEHDFKLQQPNFRVAAQGGQTASGTFTPSQEGSYDFICSIPGHKEAGMVGKLIVGPGSVAAPAAAPTAPVTTRPADPPIVAIPAPPAPVVSRLRTPQIAPPVNRTEPALRQDRPGDDRRSTATMADGVAYAVLDLQRHRPRPDAARAPGRHRRGHSDERGRQLGSRTASTCTP